MSKLILSDFATFKKIPYLILDFVVMKLTLFLLICVSFYHSVVSLKCYTCSIGEQDTDLTCVDHPEKTTPTNCNKKYCTVKRQELLVSWQV